MDLFGVVKRHHHAFIVYGVPIMQMVAFVIVIGPKGKQDNKAVEFLVCPLDILKIPVSKALSLVPLPEFINASPSFCG